MKHRRITVLSAVLLSLTTLLNLTALAFTDDRFATQVKLSEQIPGFGMTVDAAIAISGDTVIAGTQSQFSIPAVYIFQ